MNSTTEETANDTQRLGHSRAASQNPHTDTAATDLATLGTAHQSGGHPKKFALAAV